MATTKQEKIDGEYDPNGFLDWLIRDVFKVKNDAVLAAQLKSSASALSKIRHEKQKVGHNFLIEIHDQTNMAIRDIRKRLYRSKNAGE